MSSTLATKLIRIVFIIYFLCSVTVTIGQVWLHFNKEKRTIDHDLIQLAVTFESSIASSLWNMDEPHIQADIEGLMTDPMVTGVLLEDETGRELGRAGVLTQISYDAADFDTQVEAMKQYGYSFPVNHRHKNGVIEQIGTLRITSSPDIVLDRIQYPVILTIINACIKTVILWCIIYFVVTKIVSKPLSGLRSRLDELNPNWDSSAIELVEGTEIDLLLSSFEQMRDSIIEKDIQLSEHRMTLERTVEERTMSLQKTMEELEDASAIKSQFLANMSHELRTPLNGIIGSVDLVLMDDIPDDIRESMTVIKTCSESLLNLIGNILDISKIEKGGVSVELTPISIEPVVRKAGEVVSILIREKGLKYVVNVDSVADEIMGDGHLLNQVLMNLLGNAVKFTQKGTITLECKIMEQMDSTITLRFVISDTGIGISQAKQKDIFSPFVQADSSKTRKFGGSGLGLSISNEVVKAMGGTLELTSTEGEGSVFSFELQFNKIRKVVSAVSRAKKVEALRASPQLDNLDGKILVAEDNQINQQLLASQLAKLGYTDVVIVGDGDAAVELVSCDNYDIIFMDMQMPVCDGVKATARIREQGITTPIIAMTANAFESDKQACHDAGMDDFATKPLTVDVIREIIAQYVKRFS